MWGFLHLQKGGCHSNSLINLSSWKNKEVFCGKIHYQLSLIIGLWDSHIAFLGSHLCLGVVSILWHFNSYSLPFLLSPTPSSCCINIRRQRQTNTHYAHDSMAFNLSPGYTRLHCLKRAEEACYIQFYCRFGCWMCAVSCHVILILKYTTDF